MNLCGLIETRQRAMSDQAKCIICARIFCKRNIKNICCSKPCTIENKRRKMLERYVERYHTIPVFREAEIERRRKRWNEEKVYRDKHKETCKKRKRKPVDLEKRRERDRARYINDPIFRQKKLESVRKSYWKIKDSDVV